MTNTNMEIFKNKEFGSVRIIEEDGKHLFCASDVAKALGYSNIHGTLKRHCRGVLKRYTPTSSGTQEMSFIPEGDVYRLIVHSKLPSAERFERWVFDEVLPSLRANGIYITDPLVKQIAEDPDYLYALWDTLKRQNERLRSQDEIISAQSEELDLNDSIIDDLSWKANYYDDFIDESDGVTIRVAAKQIGVPERALVSLLIGCHYLYRCNGRLLPYADGRCAGLFAVREHRTLITPMGKARILELLEFLASESEAAS